MESVGLPCTPSDYSRSLTDSGRTLVGIQRTPFGLRRSPTDFDGLWLDSNGLQKTPVGLLFVFGMTLTDSAQLLRTPVNSGELQRTPVMSGRLRSNSFGVG